MVIYRATKLTQDFLKSILEYDPAAGIFIWRYRPECPRKWNTRYSGKPAGYRQRTGYIAIQAIADEPGFAAHRLAWFYVYGELPDSRLDHINGDRGDNRIKNLRKATPSDNGCNKIMQRNNTSGFPGVSFEKQRGMWRARINKNRVMTDVGFFHTAEEAAKARTKALQQIHGDFTAQTENRQRYFHYRDGKP